MDKTTLLLVVPQKLKDLKEEIQNISIFEDKQIFIQVTMINTLKNFIDFVESYNEVYDAIMIFESITEERVNVEKAQSELLESMRKIKLRNFNVKIIVVLQAEKDKNLAFINELIKIDVQNFYFTNTFSRDDLAEWIFAKERTLQDNFKYISTEIKKPEKEIVTKEVIKYIEVPVEVQKKQSEKDFVDKEFFNKQVLQKSVKSNYMIGIIGMSAGTGATSLCVKYAEYLSTENYRVLLLDRTDNKHLSSLEIKGQDIMSCDLSNVNISQYDYILIDFGKLADIQDGKVILKPDMNNEKRIERSFCNKIVLVGSTLPWKLKEIHAYIEDNVFKQLTKEWIFYLNGEENAPFKILRKSMEKKRNIIISYELDNPLEELNKC